MNKHVFKFYIYLVLGYIVYGTMFFKLCSNGWQFFFSCVIFNIIWSKYLSKYYLSQAEAEINALENAIIAAFEKVQEEQKDKKERVDALQKKSDETSAMVDRMKRSSKKKD